MDAPPVQYVKTNDGYNIAYAVSGEGTPLVALPGAYEHVQMAWQYPGLQSWLEGLSARFQLVQIDPRGTGMSSRSLHPDHTMDHYTRDIEAVVDALRLERFVFYGAANGTEMAVRYATAHPERVVAFIFASAAVQQAAFKGSAIFYSALPEQDWDLFLFSVTPRGMAVDEARRRVDLLKQAYDRDNHVLKMKTTTSGEGVAELLPRLQAPVLVLHPRDYALLDTSEAMTFAQLSNGSLVLIDGSNAFGDAGQGLRAVDTFVSRLDLGESATTRKDFTGVLSSRELEVLRLLAAGKSNQHIADALVISLNTVNRHVSNIYAKTGVANRAGAAVYAQQHGLV